MGNRLAHAKDTYSTFANLFSACILRGLISYSHYDLRHLFHDLDQTETIGQIDDQNTVNSHLISTSEEEDCPIEPKQCVEDENEVNNKIVSMLETTMDMMDKRHFPDTEDLISSPENVSENGEKLIDFENDPSTDEGINFEIQHNDDKFENISDYDKSNEGLLDSPGK